MPRFVQEAEAKMKAATFVSQAQDYPKESKERYCNIAEVGIEQLHKHIELARSGIPDFTYLQLVNFQVQQSSRCRAQSEDRSVDVLSWLPITMLNIDQAFCLLLQ